MADSSAYLIGRNPGEWPTAATPARDMIFAGVRKDRERLEGLDFEHCTFANVSFKEVELRQCRFTNCAFLNCYFRKCQMVGAAFHGSKFIECDFPRVTVESCDFRYSRFVECVVPFAEMEHSLPREPNLREELATGLALAADGLGLAADGRKYRLAAIQARDEHLRAAVLSNSEWYQRHFSGLRRLQALVQLAGSRANGLLWGHGEKWSVLVRNVLILALVGFPVALWWDSTGLSKPSGDINVADVIWLSVTTIVPVARVTDIEAISWGTRAILTTESFTGIVAAGLLVVQLGRRMLKR